MSNLSFLLLYFVTAVLNLHLLSRSITLYQDFMDGLMFLEKLKSYVFNIKSGLKETATKI